MAPRRQSSFRGFENEVLDVSQEKKEVSKDLCIVCRKYASQKDNGLSRMGQERKINLTKIAEFFQESEIMDQLKAIDEKIAAGKKLDYMYHRSCLRKVEYQYKRDHNTGSQDNSIEEEVPMVS